MECAICSMLCNCMFMFGMRVNDTERDGSVFRLLEDTTYVLVSVRIIVMHADLLVLTSSP